MLSNLKTIYESLSLFISCCVNHFEKNKRPTHCSFLNRSLKYNKDSYKNKEKNRSYFIFKRDSG